MLGVVSPMIRSVPILQMPLPSYVYRLIALPTCPVCGFFLGFEGSNFLATHHDCVMGGARAGVGGQGSMFNVGSGHEIHSLN
jgi:hypothetical protein